MNNNTPCCPTNCNQLITLQKVCHRSEWRKLESPTQKRKKNYSGFHPLIIWSKQNYKWDYYHTVMCYRGKRKPPADKTITAPPSWKAESLHLGSQEKRPLSREACFKSSQRASLLTNTSLKSFILESHFFGIFPSPDSCFDPRTKLAALPHCQQTHTHCCTVTDVSLSKGKAEVNRICSTYI